MDLWIFCTFLNIYHIRLLGMRTTQRVRSLSMRSRTHRRRRASRGQHVTTLRRGQHVTTLRGGNPTDDMNNLIDKMDLIIDRMRTVHNASPDTRILNFIIECERAKMKYIHSRSPPAENIHKSHVDAMKDAAHINRKYKEQQLQQPPSQKSWMSQLDRHISKESSKLPPRPPSLSSRK